MLKLVIATLIIFQTNIYSLRFSSIDGTQISMNSFQGKKILLVNIATESKRVGQLGELQQLQQQFGDSLVIIAFPSNSFSKETKTNAEIKQLCENTFHTSFLKLCRERSKLIFKNI
jgi:glutathione peroxidase